MFCITFESNSNEKFLITLLDKVFSNFINGQNILNEGEIKIPASFCNKAIATASNLLATANKYRRFLIGLLEYHLQLLLSQLSICIKILKTVFAKIG